MLYRIDRVYTNGETERKYVFDSELVKEIYRALVYVVGRGWRCRSSIQYYNGKRWVPLSIATISEMHKGGEDRA